jgi:hypothetical protein
MKNIMKSGLMLTAMASAPSFAGYTININPKTVVGIEVGNYKTESADSNYMQLSVKYSL